MSDEHDGGADSRSDAAAARTVDVGVVDAFATEPLAGAPVGVVPDADGIAEGTAGAIARELGHGTAFVGPSSDADADRRLWYVRAREGDEDRGRRHADADGAETGDREPIGPPIRATVAGVVRLLADDRIEPGTRPVETAAGVVDVEVTASGTVWVDRPEARVGPVDLDYEAAGGALGVDPAALRDVGADLPAAVASVGRPFLIVPVNFLERLSGAAPDRDAVAALADEHDVAGVYAVTFDALAADSTLHARCFVPGRGPLEDPVTGAAAGAAGAYLGAVDAFDGDPPDELAVEQGHFVDRPGVVRVRVTDEGVRVGGRGVTALKGRATLPDGEGDGDDILVA